jgi:hypothetical protein
MNRPISRVSGVLLALDILCIGSAFAACGVASKTKIRHSICSGNVQTDYSPKYTTECSGTGIMCTGCKTEPEDVTETKWSVSSCLPWGQYQNQISQTVTSGTKGKSTTCYKTAGGTWVEKP